MDGRDGWGWRDGDGDGDGDMDGWFDELYIYIDDYRCI